MRSKSTQDSSQLKTSEKYIGNSVSTARTKLVGKGAPIITQWAVTEKCLPRRTRHKSQKLSTPSPTSKSSSSPSPKGSYSPSPIGSSSPSPRDLSNPFPRGSSRSSDTLRPSSCSPTTSRKSKNLKQKKLADDLTYGRKKVTQKKQAIVRTKAQRNVKGKAHKNEVKQSSPKSFIDLWALASSGKREASLNASVKVNIMFEKLSPSKSSKISPKKRVACQDTWQDENMKDKTLFTGKIVEGHSPSKSSKKTSDDSATESCSISDTECDKFPGNSLSPGKMEKKAVCNPQTIDGRTRKRKSPGYKIFRETSSAKIAKMETNSPTKCKKKTVRQARTSAPSGHQLCNIIEKCPRQASLVARAMIAMDHEEDAGHNIAARTKVYNWLERRSLTQTEARRITWYNGLGHLTAGKTVNKNKPLLSTKGDINVQNVDVGSHCVPQVASHDSQSPCSNLLQTLHKIGDTRLLKEYFRAQEEDFKGNIDVEKCTTPEKCSTLGECTTPVQCTTPGQCSIPGQCSTPEKRTTSTQCSTSIKSPKPGKSNQVSSDSTNIVCPKLAADDKPHQEVEKSVACSPVKIQPCPVDTPNPQFAQRGSDRNSSVIHQPIPHPIYPQQYGQNVKVNQYSNPACIYQYAMDRPMYAAPSISPVPYAETSHMDYTPSCRVLGHMDNLTLRRGVSSFQPPPYNTPLHVPLQQIGFNYGVYYPAPMQPLPVHQPYPIIQAPLIAQQLPPNVSELEAYQNEYSLYPSLPNVQDTACILPPPAPIHRSDPMTPPAPLRQASLTTPAVALRQAPLPQHSVSPLQSLLTLNSVGARAPALDFPSHNCVHFQGKPHEQFLAFTSCRSHQQQNRDQSSSCPLEYPVSADGLGKCFSSCKKELEDNSSYNCDFISKKSLCSSEYQPRSVASSRANCEGSDVSDLLHSAHTTMYQIDSINSMDNSREFNQMNVSVSDSSVGDCSPSKVSILEHSSFNVFYSVSSIMDKPGCRVKPEHAQKMPATSNLSNMYSSVAQKLKDQSQVTFGGFASPVASAGTESKEANSLQANNIHKTSDMLGECNKMDDVPAYNSKMGDLPAYNSKMDNVSAYNSKIGNVPAYNSSSSISEGSQAVKCEEKSEATSVIVIENTDESSDDEPLSRLIKAKSSIDEPLLRLIKAKSSVDEPLSRLIKAKSADCPDWHVSHKIVTTQSKQPTSYIPKQHKIKKKKQRVPEQTKSVMKKLVSAKLQSSGSAKLKSTESAKLQSTESAKLQSTGSAKRIALKSQENTTSTESSVIPQLHNDCLIRPQISTTNTEGKSHGGSEVKNKSVPRKTAIGSRPKIKKPAKKMKAQPVWPVTPPKVSTNHGWSWVGEGQMKLIPKITQSREEPLRIRKCYQSMRHTSGEMVSVKDCVILQSDGDGSIPFVARVSALWENINGEMMFSMLWYYQPEHTAAGRESDDGDQELFASKHREENSVACIDDKCYVLMYNEYCRLEAEGARCEQGVPLPRWRELVPDVSGEDKKLCRRPPPANACADNIWFCRYDYDIRKKVARKPKHKKSNLRYRVPCKAV